VDAGRLHDDQADAASGALGVVVEMAIVRQPIGAEAGPVAAGEDAVADREVADLDRRKDMPEVAGGHAVLRWSFGGLVVVGKGSAGRPAERPGVASPDQRGAG